ncbi:MAG: hypothetical protein GY710_24975 [Desulfobacteraceae bacterium]|nr:hypothetical protein [Desulfobacteraceae bacterium]
MKLSSIEMLRLGQLLCDIVRWYVPVSENLPGSSKSDHHVIEKLRLRKASRSKDPNSTTFLEKKSWKQKHKDGSPIAPWTVMEQSAKNALRFRAGNCGELAALALLIFKYAGFLSEYGLIAKMVTIGKEERYSTAGHVFIIIYEGIDNETGYTTFQSLAKSNCVVCDPWVFKASRWCNDMDRSAHISLARMMNRSNFYGMDGKKCSIKLDYPVKPFGYSCQDPQNVHVGLSKRHTIDKKKFLKYQEIFRAPLKFFHEGFKEYVLSEPNPHVRAKRKLRIVAKPKIVRLDVSYPDELGIVRPPGP